MPEVMLYLRAIAVRKMCEAGKENELPVDSNILDLMDVISKVKKRRNAEFLKGKYE